MTGLDDLLEEEIGGVPENHPCRTYPYHEFEDKAWNWFEELNNKFPVDIKCDFIEVSPNMNSSWRAKACYRNNGQHQFIRFAKYYVESSEDWTLKRTLLHEMVHLYTYQQGHRDIGDGSIIFKWLCGAVGCEVNQINNTSPEWIDLAEPFIED